MIYGYDLKRKNIIITGGAGFLGSEYISAIFESGGIPICVDNNPLNIKKIKKFFKKKYNYDLRTFLCDIGSERSVKILAKKLKYKKIHILINNAANNPKMLVKKKKNKSGLKKFSYVDWSQDIKSGLTGAFLMTKYFGEKISKNSKGGVIINVSSDLGIISPDQSLYRFLDIEKPISYSVIKTGILGLTRYSATYWNGKVRCNSICIGGVENNQNKKLIKKLEEIIPVGRMAKKNEYNHLIIFLCSDQSSYINGSTIIADGGRTIA